LFPRLFIDDSALGAAMARAGMARQLARTIAPPLGGLLIGSIALSGVALLDVAVIPAVVLGIRLAARERGWTAAEAGLIEAGWIAGGLLAGAWYAWRGTASAAWRPMAAGPFVVVAGLSILAIAPTWMTAIAGTVVVGIGVVVFTAHLFPTYVLLAPPTMISRFQSLLILAQQAPQLLVNPSSGSPSRPSEAGR
jgi:hypothetical protein